MRLTGVEDAMYGRTAAMLFATTLLGFAGGIARYARGAGQAAADQQLLREDRTGLLAKGKELFPRAVRPLPQRARRQAAKDRIALE